MKLVTFEDAQGRPRAGALYHHEERIADLALGHESLTGESSPHLASLQALIEGGDQALEIAARALDHVSTREPQGAWVEKNKVRLLAPLPRPVQMRDFLCFKEHLINSRNVARAIAGRTAEDDPGDISLSMLQTMSEMPIYYKCNRFGVIGPDEDIVWPDYASLLDYELEFAAVIGKKAKNVPREKAREYIFGYTIFNDMSARDYQMREMRGILGPGKGKDFDTGTVIGPCIVTADEIAPDNLTMIARVNGQEVSRGNSNTMLHKFEDCLEYVTRCETLHPGEIIASGTVGNGCGFERFSFLAPHDLIELEVEGIGTLKNRIVPGPVRKNPKPVIQVKGIKGQWSDLALEARPFEKGLHSLARGVYAWLRPDGAWGLSNAGLIADSGQSLLVDTLYDLRLTREMLEAMKQAEPEAAATIDLLVNTHGDGDHWFGNELVKGADIYASPAALQHMKTMSPMMMSIMVAVFSKAPTALGKMLNKHFTRFRFAGITPAYPNRSVDGRLTLEVGHKKVELIVVGPAHTPGDLLVYVPEDRVLFAGDIVFAAGTPVVHSGPIPRYIAVLKQILDLDVDVIVPGHGPITDKRAAAAMIAYLEYIHAEARKRYDAGLGLLKAARDIDLQDFSGWQEPDRLIFNLIAAYKEFSGSKEEVSGVEKMWLLSEVGDY
ncbi:MAG: fumarylacetoacetate hydrolase family protein [Thermodesulfobacteriota bacterium]